MLGTSYFIWQENEEWYEIYDVNEEDGSYKIRLTDKAPPEAVESFEKYQKKKEYTQKTVLFIEL